MKLNSIEKITKKILEKHEEARSDDFVLVYMVYRELSPNVATMDRFSYVMLNHKELGFPSWGSITRARRKIFQKHPQLKPKVMTEKRKEEEEKFKEYSRA